MIKYYVIMSILFLSFGCKKIEYNMSEDEKKAFLYYSYDVGNSFSLLKNNFDIKNFTVIDKELKTLRQRYSYFSPRTFYEEYVFNANPIYINIFYEDGYAIIDMSIGTLSFSTLDKFYNNKEIDGINYLNVYCLIGGTDTCYTSVEHGIIKAWNDSVVYKMVE